MRSVRDMSAALAAVTAVVISAIIATQAFAASAPAITNATVITPIAIANTATLEFGDLAGGTAISVVRISVAGARSLVSGDAALVGGGTIQAASFDVTGEVGVPYNISFDASITLTSGANSMTVDTFVDSLGGTGPLTASPETFTVGADLTVGIAQAAGSYTGSVTATVDYQ